jgi:hypothetical protein
VALGKDQVQCAHTLGYSISYTTKVAGADIASRIPEAFMTHALNDFGSGDNGHWALNLASSR